MSNSALPFFNSRSNLREAICRIDIYSYKTAEMSKGNLSTGWPFCLAGGAAVPRSQKDVSRDLDWTQSPFALGSRPESDYGKGCSVAFPRKGLSNSVRSPAFFPLTGSSRAESGLCAFTAQVGTSPLIFFQCSRVTSPGRGMVSSPVPQIAE